MPIVNLLGKNYNISCKEGEEQRIFFLADYIKNKIMELGNIPAHMSDGYIMLMVCLVISDELFEYKEELNMISRKIQEKEDFYNEKLQIKENQINKDYNDAAGIMESILDQMQSLF